MHSAAGVLTFLSCESSVAWPCPDWWEASMVCLKTDTCPLSGMSLTQRGNHQAGPTILEDHFSVSTPINC